MRPTSAQLGFAAAFALMVAVFTWRSDAFWHASNLLNIATGCVVLLIVTLAMTAVVASGGIDLSVGVSLDFGAWFVIIAMVDWHLGWGPAILTAVAVTLAVGALNGLLIAKAGVSPFLATLGVYFVGRSVQQAGTNGGATVNFRQAPDAFHQFGVGSVAGVPVKVAIGLALAVALWFFLTKTSHGRRIEAIGLQPEAARHIGIRVGAYTALTYVVAAGLCALAGAILTAQLRIFTPLAGFAYQTDAIAAVFLGAALSRAGRASVPGSLAAVVFLATLSNGLDLAGLDFNVKVLVRGIVLVVALAASFGLARGAFGAGGRALRPATLEAG
ncbi:MAG: ABC transporter permease [Bifidobacteriaceae bacterium]|nr:ABC transporter permease [Bifidobacteriaceae bacterium]